MEEYIKNIDLQKVSVQTLAFLGDAIYNVYIRTYLASKSNSSAGKLHKESIKFVSAKGQSLIISKIDKILTDEEAAVYRRGRNANIPTVSKHVDVKEYKRATGFEALLGYLYIKKDLTRLEEIIKISIDVILNEEETKCQK